MEDSLFADKLELLQLYYPSFLADALSDLLRGCAGDLAATRNLIDPKPAKRSALHQTSITKHVECGKRQNTELAGTTEIAGTTELTGNTNLAVTKLTTSRNENYRTREPSPGTTPKKRKTANVVTLNTPADVARHLGPYASLHANFLPKKVADGLLDDLVTHKEAFEMYEFHLFGNKCQLNHGVATFSAPGAVYPSLVYNGRLERKLVPFSANFTEAADLIQKFVNGTVIPSVPALLFQRTDTWTSDYCVGCYYEKLLNNLDWHSDRLSHIGPHNFIASISLGATRMFRLRSTHVADGHIMQVPLPHNTLFLMRPGCQEEFKHCVAPMGRAVDLHPKVGSTRFGLTFRHYPVEFIRNLPKCACDMSMTLRRTFKSVATRGRYFWLCENKYQNKDCGSFFWCDFSNEAGHYVAEDLDHCSVWVAPDDYEKKRYDKTVYNAK